MDFMASQTYHRNKKTGVTYVYSVQSCWDKEKKSPRNKRVCLGKLDKVTGEITPSRRRKTVAERVAPSPGVTAHTRVAGPYLLLEKLSQLTGLGALLKKCFPELHKAVLSLVYYIVQKGLPLSRSAAWSTGHPHPFGGELVSQRIGEMLLGITEEGRMLRP